MPTAIAEKSPPKSSLSVQQGRISPKEKKLLKGVFSANEDLLLLVRDLLLGFELSSDEAKQIETTFKSPELRKLVRKLLLPELERNIPIGQTIDLWMTLQHTERTPFSVSVEARHHLIDDLEIALALLTNPNSEKVDLWVGGTVDEAALMARNTFISHIELQMNAIRVLANEPEETEAQEIARITKNSNK